MDQGTLNFGGLDWWFVLFVGKEWFSFPQIGGLEPGGLVVKEGVPIYPIGSHQHHSGYP